MAAVASYPSAITFASDKVVSEPADVITNLQFLLENIETFDAGNGEVGYVLHPPQGHKKIAGGPLTWKIAIGPLEVDISIDLSTFSVSIKVILNIPIIGGVTIANVVGNLKDGVTLNIGYPGVLGGTLGLKLDENNDVVFSWDFKAFGKGFQGSKVLFHI